MDLLDVPAVATAPTLSFRRVDGLDAAGTVLSAAFADGSSCAISRLLGAHLRRGDELLIGEGAPVDSPPTQVLVHRPSLKHADILQAKIGYAAQPKPDRRGEMFVRIEVPGGTLGIGAIHIPCYVVRDYFFASDRKRPWQYQQPLYRLLYLTPDVGFGELRVGYRLRRAELVQAGASKAELATLERAYNLLADPDLRAAYHQLLSQPDAPISFPYAGFGSLLVEGERGKEGDTFFAKRILAYLPERHRRKLTVPLRKIDFFNDHAIVRDRKRRLEVLIDQQLLPIKWDQTWSQWRHLITANVEISADFVQTGKYRKEKGEWRLVDWETALPSRTEVTLPPGIEAAVLDARRAHSRFGKYFDDIDQLRWHVHQIPTECDELRRRCWNLGLPGDFDVIQITWRPDYDPYYYEQLSKRCRTMYLFRDEYIFDLEKCVVVEVPQAGHATYVFAKPVRLTEFVWQYAKSTRQDILANRNNIAETLGFLARVVHGKNKSEWLKDLQMRIGEPAEVAQHAT
jgi:hypothetical protein